MKTVDPRTTAGRAFVRSLNILLKFARLYGFEHSRTIAQLQTAWNELRDSIPAGTTEGLLLAATGAQLLLDGVPLEGAPAEKQFAQLLTAAGVGSVQFFSSITQEELGRFIHAFPTGKSNSAELAEQLKSALAGTQGIRINEICFVATDSRMKDAGMAAQLAAVSLGEDGSQLKRWLNDPQTLLEMIAAAQGSRGPSGTGGPENTAQSSQAVAAPREAPEPSEAEVCRILGALTSFVGANHSPGGASDSGSAVLHEQLAQLPGGAQDLLRHALAELAAKAPGTKPDQSVLVQLAEHLAIRFALERFERGEVKVNAVRQMLDRMNQEIDNLRKVVGAHESQMSEAGLFVESHRDILDRQFWAAVPESGKRAVLLSDEAWCIPPRNIQSYVNDLVKSGNIGEAAGILLNYATCVASEDPDGRKKATAGISQLAELYITVDPAVLSQALRHLGLRLSVEQNADLQPLVSAAFVRLSQEAAKNRCFAAMEQALNLVSGVESQRPGIARSLSAKMGIEERVPEFLEEALRAKQTAAGLTNVLKLLPQTSMELLAARFNRCSLRDDAEQVANLASDLGEEGLQYLRSTVRGGPVTEAVEMIGLLSKLDPQAVEVFLPARLKDFPRASQDRAIRQLCTSGGPGKCRILLEVLDHVDPLVMPMVIDEIGVTGDREALGRLMNIAEGDLPASAGPYVRLKAVEALGRINAPESVATLKRIVGTKKVFGWLHPQELRIAALQALEKLDPAWAKAFLPKSGLDKADLILAPLEFTSNCKFVRQRRHTRVRLNRPLTAISVNLKENCRLEIRTASLAGGVAAVDRHLPPGTHVQLRMQVGMRNLQVTALTRDYRSQGMAFEFVDMSLDERSKFRRLLGGNLSSNRVAEATDAPVVASDVLLSH